MKFRPFEDESASLEIGELTIENRVDRVSLFGSIDLTRDREGARRAKELCAVLEKVVKELAALDAKGELPDQVDLVEAETVKNPFE